MKICFQDIPDETWKPCVGFEGDYSISNLGRVRRDSKKRGARVGAFLKPSNDTHGYPFVQLRKDHTAHQWYIHRLVAFAFLGCPPKDRQIVNHKDGNPLNNNVTNLEWCSQKENVWHAVHILKSHQRGERNGLAKLTDQNILDIRTLLKRKVRQVDIADTFGVDQSAISYIKSGLTWTHI